MGTILNVRNFSFTYPEAEVQQEEHVERHVDLQREVFVEVLTRLDRTKTQREKHNVYSYCTHSGGEVRKGVVKCIYVFKNKA